MTKKGFKPVSGFPCELNLKLEANVEMLNDKITELDIKETILNGEKTENLRGGGDKYQYEVIVVIADSEPCHYYVITVWKIGSDKPDYKNKSYRKRKYMKREQKRNTCPRCAKGDLQSGRYPLEFSGKTYGEFAGYGCSNCGLVFFTEESSRSIREIIQALPMKPLSPVELSLLLLYATNKPIQGAISFMKEAFLLFKEKLKEFNVPAYSPQFISYHYGPYSFDVANSWYEMEKQGLIEREGRRSTNKESFSLTKKGKIEAEHIFKSMPETLREELPSWRRGLDELGNNGILRDVYSKYLEYTDKSKIKKKVLPYYMRGRA